MEPHPRCFWSTRIPFAIPEVSFIHTEESELTVNISDTEPEKGNIPFLWLLSHDTSAGSPYSRFFKKELLNPCPDTSTPRVEAGSPDLEVFADPLLGNVFFNRRDNSLRYGGADDCSPRDEQRRKRVLVTVVEDDGNGISIEDKKQLFPLGFGKHTGLCLCLPREILGNTMYRYKRDDHTSQKNTVRDDGAERDLVTCRQGILPITIGDDSPGSIFRCIPGRPGCPE